MKTIIAFLLACNFYFFYLIGSPYINQYSTMSDNKRDYQFMQEALNEAKSSYLKKNAIVGSVIVVNNEVIARGAPSPRDPALIEYYVHAETKAIDLAIKKMGLKEFRKAYVELYTTYQPCSMCRGMAQYMDIDRIVVLRKRKPGVVWKEFAQYYELLNNEVYLNQNY